MNTDKQIRIAIRMKEDEKKNLWIYVKKSALIPVS